MTILKNSKQLDLLQQKMNLLLQKHEFESGQIVKWKKGLRNKKFPSEDQEVIVVEVLDNPVLQHETESGTPYFREPLDLVLAMLDEDNDLVIFHYDSRRFEPVEI